MRRIVTKTFSLLTIFLILSGSIFFLSSSVISGEGPVNKTIANQSSSSASELSILSALNQSRQRSWGREPSIAVVNPVVRSPLAKVLSLRGDWDFLTDNIWNYRLATGTPGWGPRHFDWSNCRKITVPGNWESQGVGEPGPNVTWDCNWDCAVWELRHVYNGRAIYRKFVTIPADWKGDQIWIKIGGVRTEAWIWVNNQRAAYANNFCGTEKFNITDLVKPGEKAEIVAMVRNDTPSRKGLLSVTHHFGGFYRDVELEAAPNLYIDDVWCRGNVDKKAAQINVYVQNANLSPTEALVEAVIKTKDGRQVGRGTASFKITDSAKLVLDIPVENCRFWTPEDPYLYYTEITLKSADGKSRHGWADRFGIRKLEVRGAQFYLNGRPYYFRGGGDHNYDSMTITEGPDRKRFLEHQKIYKAAGFNYMRHHTHAPLPEYFEAADETGILLQPELPYYHDVTTEGFVFDPMRDLQELFQNYRRYTSFGVYCCGNEGFLGSPVDRQIYRWVKKNDPDRLILHQDGGTNNKENSDFATGVQPNLCTTLIKPWKPGICDDLTVPVMAHEYLNLAIKMDPHLESKFTGVRVSPISMAKYRELLKKCDLTENWGVACLRAAEGLQAIYQKEGIEFARTEAVCDGHIFWSLVDASIPQGSTVAAQGYLDTFWNLRPNGNAPETFYKFNGPTALLLNLDRPAPIAVSGETFKAECRISHYSADDIPAGTIQWRLTGPQGNLAAGSAAIDAINSGYAGSVKTFEITVPNVSQPVRSKLEFSIAGTKYVNDWNFWIFPKRAKKDLAGCVVSDQLFDFFSKNYSNVVKYGSEKMKPTDVLIVEQDEEAMFKAISEGRDLLILSPTSNNSNVKLGWWGIGTQVGTAFAEHPCFGNFPKAGWMDQLWFRLIRAGAPDLQHGTVLGRLEPLAVGEGRESYYLYLGQGKVGKSKVLASFALQTLQEVPEALALLDNFVDYVRSAKFKPTKELKISQLKESAPDGMTLGFKKALFSPEPPSSWRTCFGENCMHYFSRQLSKDNRVEWQTAVPNKSDKTTETFIFAGGLGYFSMPKTEGFVLMLNGREILKFDLPEKAEQEKGRIVWKSKEGRSSLEFEILMKSMPGPDWFGKFYLTVPKEFVKPNVRQKITVRSCGENSHRWFAVYLYRDLK